MSIWKCPGQDRSFWKPEDIFESPCPNCGQNIEFWKDDVTLRCPACKQLVTNPRFNPGCAAWCSYASKCLGEAAKTIQNQPAIVKNRLEVAVRKKLSQEPALLSRALKAARKAGELAEAAQLSPLIPVAACLAGIPAREKGWSMEEITSILEQAGIKDETKGEIVRLIESPDTGDGVDPYRRVYEQAVAGAPTVQESTPPA